LHSIALSEALAISVLPATPAIQVLAFLIVHLHSREPLRFKQRGLQLKWIDIRVEWDFGIGWEHWHLNHHRCRDFSFNSICVPDNIIFIDGPPFVDGSIQSISLDTSQERCRLAIESK
jgi:hypothetical protein